MTVNCIFFSIKLLYVEVLVHRHSVQTIFWLPEIIKAYSNAKDNSGPRASRR